MKTKGNQWRQRDGIRLRRGREPDLCEAERGSTGYLRLHGRGLERPADQL